MKAGDVIKGKYRVVGRLPGGGKSQAAKVTDGKAELFLKLFTGTKYPVYVKGMDPEKLQRKKQYAEKFENRHREIMRRLDAPIVGGGNLVKPIDFFRVDGSYFKVYPFIQADTCRVMARQRTEKKLLFLKTFLLCLRELHAIDIVHSDIKPDNVLVEAKPAGLVAKLIDFDEAYLAGHPVEPPDRLGGDERYYSPELHLYKTGRLLSRNTMSTQSDIFAAGLLMHELGTGESPELRGGTGETPAERIASGGTIHPLPLERFPSAFSDAVGQSLSPAPTDRPDVNELLRTLGVEFPGPKPNVKVTVTMGRHRSS